MKKAQTDYYSDKILECGKDQRKLFSVVKSLMKPVESSRDNEISLTADGFIEYFTSKI